LQRWLIEITGDDEGVPADGRIEKLLRSAEVNYGLAVRVESRPIQDAADYEMPAGPHQGESLGTIFRCCTDYSDGLAHGVGLQLAQSFAIHKDAADAKAAGNIGTVKTAAEPFNAAIDGLCETLRWHHHCERIWADARFDTTGLALPLPPPESHTSMPRGSEYSSMSVLQVYLWNLNVFFGLVDGCHLDEDGLRAVAAMVRWEGENGFLTVE
jgi:hypothetical protein